MTVKIRPMQLTDRPTLIKILQDTPEFKSSEVTVAVEVIDSYLYDPVNSGYYILVAKDKTEITGYICYGPTPLTEGTWDIYWVAVARVRRGHGIGGVLTKAAEAAISGEHGRLIVIETSSVPIYENTRRFYTSHGYELIADIPDFYSPGEDKLIIRKILQ